MGKEKWHLFVPQALSADEDGGCEYCGRLCSCSFRSDLLRELEAIEKLFGGDPSNNREDEHRSRRLIALSASLLPELVFLQLKTDMVVKRLYLPQSGFLERPRLREALRESELFRPGTALSLARLEGNVDFLASMLQLYAIQLQSAWGTSSITAHWHDGDPVAKEAILKAAELIKAQLPEVHEAVNNEAGLGLPGFLEESSTYKRPVP